MKEINPENLGFTAATVVVSVTQHLINEWTNSMEILKNIKIDRIAYTNLIFESLFFGHYYVNEVITRNLNGDSKIKFSTALHNQILNITPILFNDADSERNAEFKENTIKELYNSFVEDKHKFYSSPIINILEVFKLLLAVVFENLKENKIVFIENNLKNRLRLRVGKFLAGKDSPHADTIFLDMNLIEELANSLFEQFNSIDYNKLCTLTEDSTRDW